MTEVKTKGVNFRGVLAALERLTDKTTVERAIAAARGPAGEALRSGEIVAGGWYPASWYASLLEAIEITAARGPAIIRELSREAMRSDFSTIFRIISLFVSPKRALDNATRVMARYYDGGKISVEEARDGYVRFRFDDYVGFDFRMWDDLIGGMEGVLTSMRVSTPRGKVVSGGQDGDAHMVAELVWRK